MFSPWRRTLACSPRSIPPSRTSWRRSNQKNTGVLFRSPEFFARVRTFTYGSQQVNVLTLAKNSGLQSTINPTIANELATIKSEEHRGALPISRVLRQGENIRLRQPTGECSPPGEELWPAVHDQSHHRERAGDDQHGADIRPTRSEERRVGKEGR